MKVALLHDWLVRYGGAERVLTTFYTMFPDAPIYFLFARRELITSFFPRAEIRGSFLDAVPGIFKKNHRFLLPFFPQAVESIDLSEFDLVISSSSTFIKGVITRPLTVHISYIHTPPRFLWDWKNEYQQGLGGIKRFISEPVFHYVRGWDVSAAARPDHLIANSKTTEARIKKYYRRESTVIYPPVSLANLKSQIANRSDMRRAIRNKQYFLVVSQLVPHKRIDLAIYAFNELRMPLLIIGEGPDRKKLEGLAGPTITFLGRQPDGALQEFYRNAQGVIFPGEDDFGIVPVEAMSFGKPVLAYRRGGATESMIEGITGEFFDEPTFASLLAGLEKLIKRKNTYDGSIIRKRAEEFSETQFKKNIEDFVVRVTGNVENIV